MPQIPIRLQLLNSGKLETALFYEPLLTLIEQKGGRVVWDDRKLDEPLSMTTPRPRSTCRSPLTKRLVPDAVAKDYRLPKIGRRPTADGLPALPTPRRRSPMRHNGSSAAASSRASPTSRASSAGSL